MKKLMLNKKFKKAIIASLTGSSLLLSSHAYSFAGTMDINVMEALMYLQNMLKNLQDSYNSKVNTQTPEKIAEYQAKIAEAQMVLKSQVDVIKNNVPNPLACQHLVSNSSVLSSGGAASGYTSRALAKQVQNDAKKEEKLSQIKEKLENAKKLNCTAKDVERGIMGCAKGDADKKTAGMDRNPSILDGSNYVAKDSNGLVVIKNTGNVVTQEKMGVSGVDYKGVSSAENFLDAKYGNDPVEIQSSVANNSQDGLMYNQTRKTYMNRKNQAKAIELKYLAKFSEMDDADVSADIKSLWNNAETKEVLTAMNGGKEKYVQPKNPSQQEILNYVVNKAFTKASTAISNLGEKGSESQIMAIQAKISLEMLDAMRDQNRILGSILMQSMDPITEKDLIEMRTVAEKSGFSSESK